MSILENIAAGLAVGGAAVGVVGLGRYVLAAQRRPFRPDVAPPKGSAARGVVYALTEGMAPWAKESTRRHAVTYLRGVVFHVGIFVGLALLAASPWLGSLPESLRQAAAVVLALSTAAGLAGFGIRLREPALRRLSTPDDYFTLGLVTLFLAVGALAASALAWLPMFWGISGVMLVYALFSKIRHCIYFFYTRTFFGLLFGYRGVLERAR